MLMFRRKKLDEILSAKEVLRIDSVNVKIPRIAKISLAIFSTVGLLLLFFGVLTVTHDSPLSIRISWIFLISLIYGVVMLLIFRIIDRSKPLVITERGIAISPYLAEFWEDIEQYGWETFKGVTRLPFSPTKEAVCLYLINKGFSQRNLENWTGHSMLAQYGIFFTPEQITQADRIFQKYGIKRISGIENKEDISKGEKEKKSNILRRIFAPIMLYVVIPSAAILSLCWFKVVKFDFVTCLIIFGIIDAAMITAIIWGARRR